MVNIVEGSQASLQYNYSFSDDLPEFPDSDFKEVKNKVTNLSINFGHNSSTNNFPSEFFCSFYALNSFYSFAFKQKSYVFTENIHQEVVVSKATDEHLCNSV